MKLNFFMSALAAGLLAACASNAPYRPASRPEKIEFRNDRLDIYPEDVRKNPARFGHARLAWAGIILSNSAAEVDLGGKIRMDTVFEHHYFDWEQDNRAGGVRLLISPRGEGLFRARWNLSRKDPDVSATDAMDYAAPGNLAIVYGTPESVDDDGTIVLRYRYIRILDPSHFTAHVLSYGRIGEPFRPVDARPNAGQALPSR
jgi:hypothetical protein